MGGANSGSTGGGGGGPSVGPAGVTYRTVGTDRRTVKQYGTVADAKQTAKRHEFRESGARNIDKNLKNAPFILRPFGSLFKAGSRYSRDYFTDKVLTSTRGKKNFGYNKRQFESLSIDEQNKIYAGYMADRTSGKTDAYGNVYSGRDDNNNQPILTQAPKTTYVEGVGTSAVTASPTKAEMDQASATTMSADETLLATQKKGRTSNILTSAKGLGDQNLTIKRKTLG